MANPGNATELHGIVQNSINPLLERGQQIRVYCNSALKKTDDIYSHLYFGTPTPSPLSLKQILIYLEEKERQATNKSKYFLPKESSNVSSLEKHLIINAKTCAGVVLKIYYHLMETDHTKDYFYGNFNPLRYIIGAEIITCNNTSVLDIACDSWVNENWYSVTDFIMI